MVNQGDLERAISFIFCGGQVIPVAQHRAINKKARKTNHIERFNNTLRQRVSRLVRRALSFAKKLDNPIGAIKLFICHDNLTRATA
jgi:insertion element IS1 protein InsB